MAKTKASTDVIYLADTWKWFGQHTGYAQLVDGIISRDQPPAVVQSSTGSTLQGFASRLYAYTHRNAWCCAGRDQQSERTFVEEWEKKPGSVGHVLYFERHHPLFQRWKRAPAGLVTTIHHPPDQMAQWHPDLLKDLRRVSSAIVLYQRDLDFFERHIGRGRVRFVHHGVDTEFFRPAPALIKEPFRLLFVGVNGRNLDMLVRIAQRLSKSHPVHFDLLVPRLRDKPREALKLSVLRRDPRVTLHSGVGDEALRQLYQSSYLLLLPLEHAGTCNALIEALACGTPPITTDVGGVRDYGAGSVYPVVANNDDDAMIHLIERYLADRGWRDKMAEESRRFAEETLRWSKVQQAHLDAYRELSDL